MDRHTREYREISQAGVESIGGKDIYSTLEIIMLAAESLKAIDSDFVLNISHMGFIKGMMADFNIENQTLSAGITNCISSKTATT